MVIDFIKEFYLFLKHRKKYWMIPMLIVFSVFGFLLYFSQGSAIAPFVYTLF